MDIFDYNLFWQDCVRYDNTRRYAPVGCVELGRVKAFWDGAINGEPIELALDSRKIEKMKKRPSALVVLVNLYFTN